MADPLGGAREYRCCVRTTFKLVHVLRSLVSFLFLVSTSIIFHICLKVGSSYEGHSVAHWYKRNQNKKLPSKDCWDCINKLFPRLLGFFNVIPTIFARHICFNLFITIGNTVPQVTGLDPTTVFTLSPEVCITMRIQ